MLRPKNELPFFETPVAAAGANWLLLPPFCLVTSELWAEMPVRKKKKKKKPWHNLNLKVNVKSFVWPWSFLFVRGIRKKESNQHFIASPVERQCLISIASPLMNHWSLSHSVLVKLFQCQSKRFEQQILSSYLVNSICYLHYAAILKAVRRLLVTPYFCLSLQMKQLFDRETKHLCALRVLNTAVTLWQGDACQIKLFTTFEVAAASHQSINQLTIWFQFLLEF